MNFRDITHPGAGGSEVYTHALAEYWVSQGHEVTIFCSRSRSQPATGVRSGVGIVRRGSLYTVFWHATRFYKSARTKQFDFVLDEMNTRPFNAHRYIKDAPVVMLVHQVAFDVWSHQYPQPLAAIGRYVLEPYWMRKSRSGKVMAVSESTAKTLKRFGINDVQIVGEGIATSETTASQYRKCPKESVPTVVFCGRLSTNKRPDHAIAAFERFREEVPEAQMWVIGSGSMEDDLRTQASENVHFLGRLSDHEKLDRFARAHALMATSVLEGWGLVVSEAAAVGTPAIGYDVPGLRDSIPASGGLLVHESIEAMADAMRNNIPKWIDNPPLINAGGLETWADISAKILESVEVVDIRDSTKSELKHA